MRTVIKIIRDINIDLILHLIILRAIYYQHVHNICLTSDGNSMYMCSQKIFNSDNRCITIYIT